MRFIFTLPILGILLFLSACTEVESTKSSEGTQSHTNVSDSNKIADGKPIAVDTATVLKDFASWYAYHYANIRLGQDFIGLSVDSALVNKEAFLTQLATGKFIVLHTRVKNSLPVYQLYPSPSNADIQATVKDLTRSELANYRMEGKTLPTYAFKDLKGQEYTAATTKGKLFVIKCWFIHCVACVKEFPELNALVDRYRNQTDVLFVSLATDKPEALTAFLVKKPFNYAVVPNMGEYMSQQLNITQYPTHLLVDRNGKIVKVVNHVDDLIPALTKELQRTI